VAARDHALSIATVVPFYNLPRQGPD
jgi:hypothetical protein